VTTFAIIQSGGKQYRVQPGDTVRVEALENDVGDTVELGPVYMVSNDGDVKIGAPAVSGASVEARVVNRGRASKVIVFKYKAKTRYRRKMGHRQQYTDLLVTGISI
jgi:large subunit ribosomal protein L21